ncbi:MAG TPA: Fur family transcriptional regulator [Anaerolineae bacterium]|nr:Fur family transcriptional regulator [Anaerolineae bacterium]
MVEWEEQMSGAGCRVTAPRRAVAHVLLAASAPLSPREILGRGRQLHSRLGLVTVYRTLALLEKLNLVQRIHRNGGCRAYLAASPGHRHALICQNCGQAVEFPGYGVLEDLIQRVEAASGYRVDDHLLQLFGTCSDCLRLGA